MSHKQYRIKGGDRVTAPTLLVAVGLDTYDAPKEGRDTSYGTFQKAYALAVSRRIGRRWTPGEVVSGAGSQTFWAALDALGRDGGRCYVVAPQASDALTLLGWWHRVEAGEVLIGRREQVVNTIPRPQQVRSQGHGQPLILHGRPDIIGYLHDGHPFKWVSVTNWADCSLLDMARQVGYTLPPTASPLTRWDNPTLPAVDQATIIRAYMQRLITWWLSIGGGMWKDTPGAAAFSTYKRRMNGVDIFRHDDREALKLEHAAAFGARTFCNWFGAIGSEEQWAEYPQAPYYPSVGLPIREPVVRYDTRAMYPTLLRDREYPVRLIGVHGCKSVKWLAGVLKHMGAVASVRVRSDRGETPHRRHGETVYPVGQFDTTLTTPELRDLLERGEIIRVWGCSTYHMGRPFAQWAEWVLALRTEQKRLADRVGELVVKSLANALGGRLGRVKCAWEDNTDVAPRVLWGEWCLDDGSTPTPRLMRSLCGRVQEMVREDFRPGCLGACYAHLTAYGRLWMQQVREPLGRRGCIWQHTDGIIVPERMRGVVEQSERFAENVYGLLALEGTAVAGRFLTPQHFWLEGRWVLAGVHDGFSVDDGMVSTEVVTANPVRSAIEPVDSSILRSVRHVDLSAIDPGVTVGADGWAVPPRVWVGERMPPPPGTVPTLFG